MGDVSDHQEVCAFLPERVTALKALSWEELSHYGQRNETLRTRSGSTYRIVSIARAATDATHIKIEVWGYAEKGWRRWAPYFACGASRNQDAVRD